MKESDGFHIMVFINWIELRFWVEFLINQFILDGNFSFDWDLCGKYRKPIVHVSVGEMYSPR